MNEREHLEQLLTAANDELQNLPRSEKEAAPETEPISEDGRKLLKAGWTIAKVKYKDLYFM